jgi:hypothetical protein
VGVGVGRLQAVRLVDPAEWFQMFSLIFEERNIPDCQAREAILVAGAGAAPELATVEMDVLFGSRYQRDTRSESKCPRQMVDYADRFPGAGDEVIFLELHDYPPSWRRERILPREHEDPSSMLRTTISEGDSGFNSNVT